MATKEQKRAKRKKDKRSSRQRSAADRARAIRVAFIAERSGRPRNEMEDPSVAAHEMEGMHTGPTADPRHITLQCLVDWAALQQRAVTR